MRVRVLGVDPGLTRCGLGVVDGLPSRRLSMVAVGVATSDALWDVDQRLLSIERQLEEWLEEHAPDAVAVERVFAQQNLRTVMGTAQVGGHRDGRRGASADPGRAAHAERGQGRRDRQRAGGQGAGADDGRSGCCGSTSCPRPADAADALALAVCHLWRPAGALGAPQRAPGSLTAAQRAWATAEQAARRRG